METATQTLHRLTSTSPAREWDEPIDDPRVLQDLEVNDIDRGCRGSSSGTPASLPRIALPARPAARRRRPPSPCSRAPRTSRRADARPAAALAAAAPVGRRGADDASGRTATWLFRAAGLGGRPLPARAVRRGARGLRRCRPACTGTTRTTTRSCRSGRRRAAARPTVVVTGVPWRTGWRYRERGYRHVYWDAGTMLAAAARARPTPPGWPRRSTPAFPDAAVDGAGRRGRRARVAGRGRRARRRHARARGRRPGRRGRGRRGTASSSRWSRRPSAPATATRSATPWERGAPVDVAGAASRPGRAGRARAQLAAAHGPGRGLPGSVLRTSHARGDARHRRAALRRRPRRRRPRAGRLPLARPLGAGARRRRCGDELYRVCLEQGLAARRRVRRHRRGRRRARSTTASTARPSSPPAWSRAGCTCSPTRSAPSASGMTFLDSEIPGLLGEPLDGAALHLRRRAGVPVRGGRLPGAPTEIRMVQPRLDDE